MALDDFRKTSMRIDKANQRFIDYQHAKAGDVNGRELLVQITNNGVVEDQTGTTLKLNWQHENGNQDSTNFNVVDIKTGKYSLYYPSKMLYKGTVDASVEINSNGQTTNTMNFKIIVHADVFNGEAGTVNGVFISLAHVNKKLDDREKEYKELKERQTSIETQFNSVQQELTDTDVNSAPEIIVARDGEDTLNDRLNKHEEKQATLVEDKLAAKQLSAIRIRKPLVLFTDDDGNKAIMTKLKPISEDTGVPFNIALLANLTQNGTGISIEQAKQLQNDLGWEVLSHGMGDVALGNVNLTDEEIEYQTASSMVFFRENGLNVQNYVYPGGQASSRAIRIVSKYANAVLGTGVANNNYPLQTYNLNRQAFPAPAPNNNLAYYKSKVDEAVANNQILIWMLHCGMVEFDTTQQQHLRDLIAYTKSLNVEMPTVQGALDIAGNIIDVNDREFYMAADGTNNIINTLIKGDSPLDGSDVIKISDLPDSFPKNKVTVSMVNNGRSLSPSGRGGVLITTTLSTAEYSSQTFIDQGGRQFTRHAITATTWSRFNAITISKNKISVTIPSKTVAAGTSFWQVVSNNDVLPTDAHVAQPQGTLEQGLTWSCWSHGHSAFVLEIYNPTKNDISMAERVFNIHRFS